ncbi:MAG: hypothetical protein AB7N71_04470 [Phycisphaerae bacterium]
MRNSRRFAVSQRKSACLAAVISFSALIVGSAAAQSGASPIQEMTPVESRPATPAGPDRADPAVQSAPSQSPDSQLQMVEPVENRPLATESPSPEPTPENPASRAASSAPLDVEFKVARATQLYTTGNEEDEQQAEALFEQVLTQDPNNAVALYYVGLINLETGLRARQSAQSAADPLERPGFDQVARRAFERAQEALTRLLQPELFGGTPERQALQPLEAGLDLSIALLADADVQTQRARTEKAVATLSKYSQEFPEDHLGYFFLGVATWRLATIGKEMGLSQEEIARAQRTSDESFNEAGKRVTVARQAAPDLVELRAVEIYIDYYRGIAALEKSEFDRGIEILTRVSDDADDSRELIPLSLAANRLIEVAERVKTQSGGPKPITFFEDQPYGPIEFRGELRMNTGYDSNVPLLGDDTAPPIRIPNQSDIFGGTTAAFELARVFNKQRDPDFDFGESLRLSIGGDTTHRWHSSIREFDINQYRGRVAAQWEFTKYNFATVEYQYSYTLLGHDPFIASHDVFFGLTHIWADVERASYGTRSIAYYAYSWRNYLDRINAAVLDRDGAYQLIGLRQTFDVIRADDLWSDYYGRQDDPVERDYFAKRWVNAWLGYEYRNERTQGTEFDLYSHGLRAGIFVPLPYRLDFEYQLGLLWDNYSGQSVFDYTRDERFDMRQEHFFSLAYTIVPINTNPKLETLEVKVRAFAEFVLQDSNVTDSRSQDIYSYDRGNYGIALEIGF